MKCPKCHKEVEKGSLYCPYCLAEIPWVREFSTVETLMKKEQQNRPSEKKQKTKIIKYLERMNVNLSNADKRFTEVEDVLRTLLDNNEGQQDFDRILKENQEKAKKKREKKGTSAEEINKMATTSTRNVGTSSSKAKGRAIDAEKEEKITPPRGCRNCCPSQNLPKTSCQPQDLPKKPEVAILFLI